MFDLFATVLAWFYAITHNYALAIALLTLGVMLALTPLTLKGTKSMLQLQKLQPQIKRLQAEHKGDRQKLNEEMMGLYKENRINPLSGCLPLLLQAPIFFILYRVLRGLTRECPAPPGKTIPGLGTCVKPAFNPDYIKQTSEMFQSLFGKFRMMSFGLNLAEPATKQLSVSFIHGLPYLILVVLVGALSYYQQRQVSSRMKDQVNPQQQMIMKVIPGFFALIALTLPAGLIVYFLTSSLYRIAQQAYITRKFYRQEAAEEADAGGGGKKAKPAPGTSVAKDKAPPKPVPRRPSPNGGTRPQPSKGASAAPPKGSPARPPKSAAKGPEGTDASAAQGSDNGPSGRPSPTRPTPRPRTPTRPTPKKK